MCVLGTTSKQRVIVLHFHKFHKLFYGSLLATDLSMAVVFVLVIALF